MILEEINPSDSLNAAIDEIRDTLNAIIEPDADGLATVDIADTLSEDAEHSGDDVSNDAVVEGAASDDAGRVQDSKKQKER
jgi:hypothetical protein